jgi:hypothetical protein
VDERLLLPVPLHLGALHPWEQALTLLLAFGPFLLLGGVIWWRQRHEPPDGPERPGPPGSPASEDDRTDQPAR